VCRTNAAAKETGSHGVPMLVPNGQSLCEPFHSCVDHLLVWKFNHKKFK